MQVHQAYFSASLVACGASLALLAAPGAAQSPNERCTLFGGCGGERVQGVWPMPNGDVLVCGETTSVVRNDAICGAVSTCISLPVPENPEANPYLSTLDVPYDACLSGTQRDAYIAVLDEKMSDIKYFTYLGGSGDDRAYFAIQEVEDGPIWVCGFTTSLGLPAGQENFPVTNCFRNPNCTSSGGGADVFVAQFDHKLNLLMQSTIIGGLNGDENTRGTLWIEGDFVYVSGSTLSGPSPASGAFKVSSGMPGPRGGSLAECGGSAVAQDAFIAKLDKNNGTVVWNRCLTGPVNNDSEDRAWANVRVNTTTDEIYIAGCTSSNSFDLTNAIDSGAVVYGTRSGLKDAFIARLSQSGGVLAVRYIGGSGTDCAAFNDCLELDLQGRPVILGQTRSFDLPCTAFALSSKHSNDPSGLQTMCGKTVTCSEFSVDCDPNFNDVFLAKYSADLSTPIYVSYINKLPSAYAYGSACLREEPAGLALHRNVVYLGGETDSQFFPTTGNAFDSVASAATLANAPCGGVHDGFFVKLFPGVTGASVLHYSTFFGGDILAGGTVAEPGTRVRRIEVVSTGTFEDLPIFSGMTTTKDFGLPHANAITTAGTVIRRWLGSCASGCGAGDDERAGFVEVHNP